MEHVELKAFNTKYPEEEKGSKFLKLNPLEDDKELYTQYYFITKTKKLSYRFEELLTILKMNNYIYKIASIGEDKNAYIITIYY